MDLLSGLNEAQKEVVLKTEGSILVLAGAGSGKTKALTHRIAYLISEKKIKPENILAITFTNKAATEMKTRVNKLIHGTEKSDNYKINLPTMGTFHSVCARVLRKWGHLLGYPNNFVILDEDDSIKIIKDAMKKAEMADSKISPKVIKSKISDAKNKMISPSEFNSYSEDYYGDKLTLIYGLYQKELLKNESMDFDDLLVNTVKLFKKHPESLIYYQNIWQYILIDEYQDTNEAQYLFAKLISEKNGNLCVVGDDWQSIYSWRGANFENILNFSKDWPNAKIVKLEENYRSTKSILAAAQKVIEKNNQRSKKELWTENESGTPIVVYESSNETEEASFICRQILSLSSKYNIKDIAIFYRTNAQSRIIEEQLLRYRIPYRVIGGVRFYERKEIKDAFSWLKICSGVNDWISFSRSIQNPNSGIGQLSINKIKKYCDKNNIKISEIIDSNIKDILRSRTFDGLKIYFEKINKIKEKFKESLYEGIKATIRISGLKGYYSEDVNGSEERIENLNELLSVAREYENLKGEITLSDYLEEIALIADIDNYNEDAEGVTLMTLHTSKGLEYPVVFIVGLEENIFPHSRSNLDPSELEEERRLFYVGMTRAKKEVYLTYARSRLFFGSISSNMPSRFLADIPTQLLKYINTDSDLDNKDEILEERTPGSINVGDKIEHENFGIGEVRKVYDDELTIYFPGYGKKILSIYYAPIKKV